MRKTLITLMFLLFAVNAAAAGALKELLKDVNPNKVQRLTEYNDIHLQKITYLAIRHRIVKVDTKLLLKDDDFTLTPFDDMGPLHIKQTEVVRQENWIRWTGQVQNLPPMFEPFRISAHAWDTDPSGNASPSRENRFKSSEQWQIDESGVAFRQQPVEGEIGIVGPAPQTAEDIEHHRRLKRLKKSDFYSTYITFNVIDINSQSLRKFVLTPLEYTPKYSVIYQADPEKRIPIDYVGVDENDPIRQRGRDYQTFKESLPKQTKKAVRGDVQ